MKAIIMAGGHGERFWPLTHEQFPKYLIRVDGKESLLRKTYRRLLPLFGKANIHVITTEAHAALIRRELPELSKKQVLIEPFRNNTAAAIYFSSAVLSAESGEEAPLCFFPADHLIRNEREFASTVKKAVSAAKREPLLVTIGIPPSFPATGYGYIEKAEPIAGGVYRVRRFVEKPDAKTAGRYLKSKKFFWNAGMFVWRAGVFLEAMKKNAPEFSKTLDLKHLNQSYKRLPNTSIDYALMEKAGNVAVCDTRMDWCDIGNWDRLRQESGADGADNYILNTEKKPVLVFGLENIVVVNTARGLLVCPKGRAEEAVKTR